MNNVYILYKTDAVASRVVLHIFEEESIAKQMLQSFIVSKKEDERYFIESKPLLTRGSEIIRLRYTPPSKVIIFPTTASMIGVQFCYMAHMFSIHVHINSMGQAFLVLFKAMGVLQNTIIVSDSFNQVMRNTVIKYVGEAYETV